MDLHVDWGTAFVTVFSLAFTHGTGAFLYWLKKRDEYRDTIKSQKEILGLVTELKANDVSSDKKIDELTRRMGTFEGEVKQALGAASQMEAICKRLDKLEAVKQ